MRNTTVGILRVTLTCSTSLGDVHAILGNRQDARAAYSLALAVLGSAKGQDAVELAHSEIGLADLDLQERRLTSAGKRYARALVLLEGERKTHDVRRARARFGQARVMVAEGRNTVEALALARMARDALAEEPSAARHLRAVESWLAER